MNGFEIAFMAGLYFGVFIIGCAIVVYLASFLALIPFWIYEEIRKPTPPELFAWNFSVDWKNLLENIVKLISTLALFWAIAVICYFLIDILNLDSWDVSQVQPLGWVIILAIVSLIGYVTYSLVSNKNRFEKKRL